MRIILNAIVIVLSLYWPAAASQRVTPEEYLKEESSRIATEGDRIKEEGDRLYAAADRLNLESRELRKRALHLDGLWRRAQQDDPSRYRDYPGRDKSQKRMRADALQEDRDALRNRRDVRRLYGEASRLWHLAGRVNPHAADELIQRILNCCKPPQKTISQLRHQIAAMARRARVHYVPR
jgi:hypothetical protein